MSRVGMEGVGGGPLLANPSSHGPAAETKAAFPGVRRLFLDSAAGLCESVRVFCPKGGVDWGAAGGCASWQLVGGNLLFTGGGLRVAIPCLKSFGPPAQLAAFLSVPGLALVGG